MTFDDIVKRRPPSHPIPQSVLNGTKIPSKHRALRLNHQQLDTHYRMVGTPEWKKRLEREAKKVVNVDALQSFIAPVIVIE